MEPIDRKVLKERSKELIRTAQPPVWQMTLVFLLATTVVENLISMLNPVSRQATELLNTANAAAVSGNMDAVLQIAYDLQRLVSGPAWTLTLLVSVLLSLYIAVMNYGYVSYSLAVVRNQETGYSDLFSKFYMAGKIILAEVLQFVFIYLWTLLFIVPGIIAAYRYRMIVYCLLEDPDCSVMEAFRRSKALMDGRKWELFVVDLSFLGWALLAALVSGILGSIPVVGGLVGLAAEVACCCLLQPYQSLTYAQWYEAIRPQTAQPETDGVF